MKRHNKPPVMGPFLASAVLACALGACSGPRFSMMASTADVAESKGPHVSGEYCDVTFFNHVTDGYTYVPSAYGGAWGGAMSRSAARGVHYAIKDALRKAGPDFNALADVDIEQDYNLFRMCYRVEGIAVRVKRP